MAGLSSEGDRGSGTGVEVPDPHRVAIVDDHHLVVGGLKALLEGELSHVVRVVYAGDDPSAALDAGPEVLVLDVDLGPGAPHVLDTVAAAQAAQVKVLLLCAVADPAAVKAAMQAGALGFVAKRASLRDLCDAVDSVIAGELHLSPELAAIISSDVARPDLSPQEIRVLQLYATGMKAAAVARRLDVSAHTVKEYLKRIRSKYAAAGRTARTRTELYVEATRDGLLIGPGVPAADE